MIRLVCPNCKKSIDEKKALCPACNERFDVVDGIIDLRPKDIKSKVGDWRLEAFEKAYGEIECLHNHYDWAKRSGIPLDVEDYRYPKLKGKIIEWMRPRQGSVVFDLGCGGGYFLSEIGKKFDTMNLSLVGVEVSLSKLMHFKRRIREEPERNYSIFLGNGEKLPFATDDFDIAVCSEVLEHIEIPLSAIREVSRVLKPGGYFYISTPSKFAVSFWNAVFFLPRLISRLIQGKGLRFEKLSVYDKPISAGNLKSSLRESGFQIIRFERNVFLPHESYFQFFPGWLTKLFLFVGGLLETCLKRPLSFLGLHFVVECRNTKTQK